MDPDRACPKPSRPPESEARRAERLRRQAERIAELTRLMRAAAAFARGGQFG